MKVGRAARLKRLRKVLAPVAVGIAAAASTFYALRRPLPRTDAELWPGRIAFDVQVVRDRWGVPHVYAATFDDLFFAQGYVHAQDRLWQMELNRRASAGTLSEVLGEAAVEADRLLRRLGFRRSALAEPPRLSDQARRALEAYVQGVNAYIDGNRHRLPIEFGLLRFQPAAWTPVDSLAFAGLMAWSLSMNWDTELIRARIVRSIGAERASALEPDYPGGHLSTVPSGADDRLFDDRFLVDYRATAAALGLPAPGEATSNAWAVDGTQTTTGKPLLASDPHLPPRIPPFWYLIHLEGAGLNVAGASLPGLPTVLIGHNERIAWGVTASKVDCQDLVVERFHPDSGSGRAGQYEYRGEWLEAEQLREEIRVRGRRQLLVETVYVTRHGPIVSPPLDAAPVGGDHLALAFLTTPCSSAASVEAAIRLNRAANWNDFRAALAGWGSPPMNFVYADVDGNVGYQLTGTVPIRAKGSGWLPVPGWTGEYEWTGTVPFADLPSALNPASHIVVSANNRIAGADYPHHLSHEWADGYRARRIAQALAGGGRFTVADFARLQGDVLSLAAADLLPLLADLAPADANGGQALALLRTWDQRVTAESAGAAIYEALRLAILRNALADLLGPHFAGFVGNGISVLAPTNAYVARGSSILLHQLKRLSPSERTRLLERSLDEAVGELTERMGEQMVRWRWGKLHRVRFEHPLGQARALRRLLSRGPYPIDGDADTVCQASFDPARPYEATSSIASYRQVIDLADFDRSVASLPTGQSGHPGSRHYANRTKAFRRAESHPLVFSKQAIFANVQAVLTLRAMPTLAPR